jgi:membrane protease YdiL (CAAX protease family)
VAEAIAVLGVTLAAVGLVHNSALARWEQGEIWTADENVTMLAVPLLWLWITGRRFADYGLGAANLKPQWDAVCACAIPFAAFALPSLLDWNGFSWLAILFMFGAPVAALYLFAFRLRKKAPAAMVLAPCLLFAFAPHAVSRAAAGLTFYVLLLGPSEEVLFRGVIQSRLNLAFGRPFTFHGAKWGWGTAIASALFGLLHAVNPYALFAGQWHPIWLAAPITFCGALPFAFLRERTGGVLAPGLLHAWPQGIAFAIKAVR